eukprot:CAMPEP_0197860866 /NCGR_PEP_ID=MMETSP1438-20131217/36528_1 /TAXON_ID=1461541 /ORGANISM="Pterosperma sp., Strain CCMP1384" /LENGTH=221 /DNA_ID=CAMNT_0043477867 /DNA_START=315 /DNA_END=977 /DNA_ORIENTATION=+
MGLTRWLVSPSTQQMTSALMAVMVILGNGVQLSEAADWEWSGEVSLKAGAHWWYAGAKNGAYADATMKFLCLKGKSVAAVEADAHSAWDGTTVETLAAGGTITCGKLYQFVFDEAHMMHRYKVDITDSGDYVFFTEHFPIEFESCETGHFFKTKELVDVEFSGEEGDHSGHDHGDHADDHDAAVTTTAPAAADDHDDHADHDDHDHGRRLLATGDDHDDHD